MANRDFVERVYDLVALIPRGRVTTYGRIARALGEARAARQVGWALHAAPPERQLPCQRVVNRNGELTGGWHWGHPDVMKALLLDEGVPFRGEYQVDLARCLWEPALDDRSPADGGDPSAMLSRRPRSGRPPADRRR